MTPIRVFVKCSIDRTIFVIDEIGASCVVLFHREYVFSVEFVFNDATENDKSEIV